MAKAVTSPGDNRLAGLIADMMHKVQHGGITCDHIALFNQGKNPYPKEDNKTTSHLKLISGGHVLSLPATDGKRTIAQAGDLFTGYIDPDYVNWGLDVSQASVPAMSVDVFEQTLDGTFANIFDGVGRSYDSMAHTQNQIVVFCEKHRDWLPTEGYGTFFLFKEDRKFFVAKVRFDDARRLYVDVHPLSDDDVWNARFRYRFVLPQLPV